MIQVTPKIALDEGELHFEFLRASGPGGQHVNRSATAVQLRFNVAQSPSLPPEVRTRLMRLAGKRITQQGELVITARRHRSQARNRREAVQRLVALIRRAALPPTPRRPTRPSPAARRRRLEAKKRHAAKKRARAYRPRLED
jgi:ribosome-associated protein